MLYFQVEKRPPLHMSVTTGQVITRKYQEINKNSTTATQSFTCDLCHNLILEKNHCCLNILCNLICHLKCLADICLEPGEYVPIEVNCPKCNETFLWGDIVNKYKGYYGNDSQSISINLVTDFEEN